MPCRRRRGLCGASRRARLGSDRIFLLVVSVSSLLLFFFFLFFLCINILLCLVWCCLLAAPHSFAQRDSDVHISTTSENWHHIEADVCSINLLIVRPRCRAHSRQKPMSPSLVSLKACTNDRVGYKLRYYVQRCQLKLEALVSLVRLFELAENKHMFSILIRVCRFISSHFDKKVRLS